MKITGKLSKTWLTADHHFGHTNIIEYCKRSFSSIEEMDTALIDAWNRVVGRSDMIFHLADFTLGNLQTAWGYLRQLNGRIYMMRYSWHHDRRWLPSDRSKIIMARRHCVSWLDPLVVLEVPALGKDGRPLAITLCHYPLAEWDRKHYEAIHCHAHCHGNYDAEGKIIDVGVDSAAKMVGEYRPLNLAEIVEMIDG